MRKDILGSMVVIILAVIIMTIVPSYYTARNMDVQVQGYVSARLSKFVDSVRNGGYINKAMMDTFSKQIGITNNLYSIQIIHEHLVHMPVYDGEVFQGESKLVYENTYDDEILEEIYLGDGEYTMSEGDYITVTLVSKSKTLSQTILSSLLPLSKQAPVVNATYGGRVRDDLD